MGLLDRWSHLSQNRRAALSWIITNSPEPVDLPGIDVVVVTLLENTSSDFTKIDYFPQIEGARALEATLEMTLVLIELVRIHEVVVFLGHKVFLARHVSRQMVACRIIDQERRLGVAVQMIPNLKSQAA